jgi:uncharacterized protein with PIN domain
MAVLSATCEASGWPEPALASRPALRLSTLLKDGFLPENTPRCPHCERPVRQVETVEVPSTQRGFRVVVVFCPSCHKILGIGGLGAPTG